MIQQKLFGKKFSNEDYAIQSNGCVYTFTINVCKNNSIKQCKNDLMPKRIPLLKIALKLLHIKRDLICLLIK